MSKLRDDFLVRWCGIFGIDPQKPLRLQKRELLNAVGFTNAPVSFGLCRCSEQAKVSRCFFRASKSGYPFFIVVSEKQTSSIVPPLFTVRGRNDILYRNAKGGEEAINEQQMFGLIATLGKTTWLEYVKNLWRKDTLAGRLLYYNEGMQTLELQQGVKPAHIPDARMNRTFIGTTSFFGCSEAWYKEAIIELQRSHFENFVEFDVVWTLLRKLKKQSVGFEQLREVGSMPTLEFAYIDESILAIDIDWPTQWQE